MKQMFLRIIVGNEEKDIWRVSGSQYDVVKALEDVGALGNNVRIEELNITLMD